MFIIVLCVFYFYMLIIMRLNNHLKNLLKFIIIIIIIIVDQPLCSWKNRFKRFQIYENIFGFLFDLKLNSLDHDNLENDLC